MVLAVSYIDGAQSNRPRVGLLFGSGRKLPADIGSRDSLRVSGRGDPGCRAPLLHTRSPGPALIGAAV